MLLKVRSSPLEDMRCIILCLLVSCGSCGGQSPTPSTARPVVPGYDPIPDQSSWLLHRVGRGAPIKADAHVRLEPDGRVAIKDGAKWRMATLKELSAHIYRWQRRLVETEQAQGRTGLEVDERGTARVSGLVLDIRVDQGSSWSHLMRLMNLCTAEKIDKLQIRTGDRTIFMFLPWDASIYYIEPLPHVYAKFRVVGAHRKGAKPHEAAADVRYQMEGRELDLGELRQHLEDVRRNADEAGKSDVLVVAPTVLEEVQIEKVLDVVEVLLDLGMPRVDWNRLEER